ncbi:DEP domain-containing protein 1B-like isoform X4 [Dreissena polymorpha]|uniref:DEP domain-containing protein 1B-like isoform X4 n=1 Tax=Dreissena polymorpha TaxID=45954 RepID=UPI0022656672|nr:DEP domain-containing protein 1B-like isoform X4 [Dreissena polymorpha]
MGEHITAGPYRATLLWNSLIRSFRNGIELGRHRRYMKTYDECFVASDAVEWMHQYLTENPNFGTDVSRAQAVQLLKKLHKSRLFEDVRGPKHNRGEFTDSSRLFRLTLASPSKSIRTPIALRNNLKLANLRRHTEEKTSHAEPVKLDFDRMSSLPSLHDNKTTLPECHFVTKPLTAQEIEEQWKLLTFESLEKILGVQGLDDIIEPRYVSGRNIMHNCLYINKSGVVTNIDPKDQLPHWALSAMKCLAYWPDKTDENLPNYPGFEKDVFRVVKDYFCGLKEPLMTYNMYEVITNVFECQDASEGYSSATNILDLSPIHPVHENSRTSPNGDGLPLTRFETAFGPDNQTVTRVFYGDGIATDYNHEDSRNQSHHTPVETHFESDISPSSTGSSFFRKTSLRHSMHNLFNRGPSIRDRKSKKDKNSARRCSTGYGLNDDSSYGCTVGVYSRSSSDSSSYDTPVSRLPAVNRTESCTAGYVDRSEKYRSKPPIHNRPPSFDALYPESKYPKTHEPVIDASKRPSFFKRKKSLSTASLHAPHRKSVVERPDPGIKNLSSVSDGSSKGGPGGKEVGNGRSLSLSDLVGAAPPIENELQKQCQGRIRESDDSLTMDDCTERIVKALQLVCLLLPPANRRRLHLLLRLINKMATNDKLVLDKTQPLRLFLLETFSRAVLCCHDEGEMDDQLVIQLVAFLMDHYVDVFAVPIDLKTGVEARITKLQRTKVTRLRHDSNIYIRIRYASEDPATLHYCQKVSLDEYENQRLTASQQALATLLEEIIQDNSMSSKEKKKRLKQFQKMHPDIYLRRFPCSLSEPDLYPSQPRIKPPLLAKPLLKLKGLRL